MTNRHPIRSYEYKNDYLYIVIRQVPEHGPKTYSYCSGISISRFDPANWRKAGVCSNPAFKGLQLLHADVSARALKLGARTRHAGQIACGSMTPRGDGWHRESTLLVENAAPRTIQALLEFSVTALVKKVLAVCAPQVKVPAKLPNPPALQRWLESLHVKNHKPRTTPPVAAWWDRQ